MTTVGEVMSRNLLTVDPTTGLSEAAARMSRSERIAQAIELSEIGRSLALGLGNREILESADDLAEKSRLYCEPLRLLLDR